MYIYTLSQGQSIVVSVVTALTWLQLLAVMRMTILVFLDVVRNYPGF